MVVSDHSTLNRRAAILEVPKPCLSSREPIHLLVDSTGLQLCGSGEWLVEKHGTRRRRSWRKLHTGVDAETEQILASELTSSDVDDGLQVGPCSSGFQVHLLPSLAMEPTIRRASTPLLPSGHPDARVIVPPRSTAVLSNDVETAISQLKRVNGTSLRSLTDRRRTTEIAIAIQALNRMLQLGHPKSAHTA